MVDLQSQLHHNSDSPKPKKTNRLSIRLAESAVFLPTDGALNPRLDQVAPLRGLLVLDLVKPTKITSIDVELSVTTSTSWPEGFGERRVIVTEERRVFHASTTYFNACKTNSARRTASIEPEVAHHGRQDIVIDAEVKPDEDFDGLDYEDVRAPFPRTHEHTLDASHLRSRSRGVLSRTNSDDAQPTHVEPIAGPNIYTDSHLAYPQQPASPSSQSMGRPFSITDRLHPHRIRVDGSHFPLMPVYEPTHEQDRLTPMLPYSSQFELEHMVPIPPYSLLPVSSSSVLPPSSGTTQSLGEFRNSNLRNSYLYQSQTNPSSTASSTPSLHSTLQQESSLSRNASLVFQGPIGAGGAMVQRGSCGEPQVGAVEREQSRTKGRESRSWVRLSKRRGKRVLGGKLKEMEKGKGKEEDNMEGCKIFKKGTYTYPISFSIPSNVPPSMKFEFGSVIWKMKASVHRPGAFKPKMTSSREVVAIACPTEVNTEGTETIIVEQNWEHQLQYLISISGRSFYVGGTIPVTFTFMPLMQVRIHRLSVVVEERVEYYTNKTRIVRTDPVTRFTLLCIKGEGKCADPILPLDSDSADAFRNSPFFALVDPHSKDAELSDAASSLVGPGPWTFHQDLQLPGSCDMLRFTNRNRGSNITVTHTMKIVMSVERGDDEHMDNKTGKRKLFDVVVQIPIPILSCRCNSEWMTLPHYAKVFDDSIAIVPTCPCQVAREQAAIAARAQAQVHSGTSSMSAAFERIKLRRSSKLSTASMAEGSPTIRSATGQTCHNESMLLSSSLFERLVSGQEDESGEAPPAYDTPSMRIPSSRHLLLSAVPITHGVAVL